MRTSKVLRAAAILGMLQLLGQFGIVTASAANGTYPECLGSACGSGPRLHVNPECLGSSCLSAIRWQSL